MAGEGEDEDQDKIVRVTCRECGGWPKNHGVLRQFKEDDYDDSGELFSVRTYQICQCLGCNAVSFREMISYEQEMGVDGEPEQRVTSYPDTRLDEYRPNVQSKQLPETVARMYSETLAALNAGAVTLAGGGLRAIVEAICKDRGVSGHNLAEKIDDLVAKQLLAKPQAELLHEERYIGNAALHELLPPEPAELTYGLKIVEGLMNTIYVLPKHAEKLRQGREKREGKA